jgi:hypothetical protein
MNRVRLALLPIACLGAFYLVGCHSDHYEGHHTVIITDEHGYRHEGWSDEHGQWHGGYYDEHNAYHDDPKDWHHD